MAARNIDDGILSGARIFATKHSAHRYRYRQLCVWFVWFLWAMEMQSTRVGDAIAHCRGKFTTESVRRVRINI